MVIISVTLKSMYAAQANSPAVLLTAAAAAADTILYISDDDVLPTSAPYLLTLGFDTDAPETVLVTTIGAGQLTVTRGVEGTASIWPIGTVCARVLTAKDINDIHDNIVTLKGAVDTLQEDDAKLTARTNPVTGTATLTNTQAFPFNNSKTTVAIATRDNVNYAVDIYVSESTGNVGDIIISDKLVNGFKVEFTGSATSVTIKYVVLGGMN